MKKLILFGLALIASMGILTSCKKDTTVTNPTISFLNNVTSYNATANDTSYTFVADVEATGSLDNIKLIDVSVDGIETQLVSITKFDSDTKDEVKYTVSNLKT